MSKLYLLYDHHCFICRQVALEIEEIAGSKLNVLGLSTDEGKSLLQKAFSDGWEHKPYLVSVANGEVVATSDIRMGIDLVRLFGLHKGWRIWQIAYRYGYFFGRETVTPQARRDFLKKMGNVTLSLAVAPKLWTRDVSQILSKSAGQEIVVEQMDSTQIADWFVTEKDAQVQAIWEQLTKDGFRPMLDQAKGLAVTSKLDKGVSIAIPFQAMGETKAVLQFTRKNAQTYALGQIVRKKQGVLISGDLIKVEAGKVWRENNILWRREDGQYELQAGNNTVVLDSSNSVNMALTDCDICTNVFNYLWTIGCAVSGFLACNVACLPFASLACPLICSVVYALICMWGANNIYMACGSYCCDDLGGQYCNHT